MIESGRPGAAAVDNWVRQSLSDKGQRVALRKGVAWSQYSRSSHSSKKQPQTFF